MNIDIKKSTKPVKYIEDLRDDTPLPFSDGLYDWDGFLMDGEEDIFIIAEAFFVLSIS